MARLLGETLGSGLGVAMVLFWPMVLLLGLSWPIMAFVSMRNVRGIRKELERLNENLEARRSGPGGGIIGL